jgi:aminotransferase in exopolysaccharide biosynthesis
MFEELLKIIRSLHNNHDEFLPLHAPVFKGNEKRYVEQAIDSTFVSSVGQYVVQFEDMMRQITGAKYAIAIVNGTCALHLALLLAGVENGDEVITQPLTFVATANAIAHANANPHFVDVDKDTMGMSPAILRAHLEKISEIKNGRCYNKITGKKIAACVPMHTFGLPLRIDEIIEICNHFLIPVVEDSTEAIGSYYKGQHTGTFGQLGTFSFNGNKTVTCGAGGAIITNNDELGKKAKHLSTTAKIPHPWAFRHDAIAFNYRMPNLNAALACAQLEQLDRFIADKRKLADEYRKAVATLPVTFVSEIENARSNYWLCCLLLQDRQERDAFLSYSNERNVMTRPAWELMNRLDMFKNCFCSKLGNSEWLEDRIVNIPSSIRS